MASVLKVDSITSNVASVPTITSPILSNPTMLGTWDGWISANETWTYASSDAPTYTFTIGVDVTTKYSAGMRIKLTDSTVKYFIITSVSAYTSTTTLTLYGGTDYTLSGGAITLPYYSTQKAPFGFPLNPAKWTVEVKYSSTTSQAPAQNTWYNIGSITISIPIGVWRVYYEACIFYYKAAALAGYATLSTANNSESDSEFTCRIDAVAGGLSWPMHKEKLLTLAAKTSYYLNERTTTASVDLIEIEGVTSPAFIRAECAYL